MIDRTPKSVAELVTIIGAAAQAAPEIAAFVESLISGRSDARETLRAASIMGTNPMDAVRPRRRVIEIVHTPPEYDDDGGPPDAA